MADFQSFKVDTTNYLGIGYKKYCDKMYGMAISKPADYMKLREEVLEKVKTEAIKNIYETIYYTLSEGKLTSGGAALSAGGNTLPAPAYPKQKINDISLAAAETLDNILDTVIEIILPLDYKVLANARLTERGRADAINPNTTA